MEFIKKILNSTLLHLACRSYNNSYRFLRLLNNDKRKNLHDEPRRFTQRLEMVKYLVGLNKINLSARDIFILYHL